MAKVTQIAADLALPFVEKAGCSLWDVEYVKEAGCYFLRVYIDKEGGVSINDCEAVSRPLSDALDESDPIEDSYVLEVSSAGADRVLKKPEHFNQFLGDEVEVKFYKAIDGRKSCVDCRQCCFMRVCGRTTHPGGKRRAIHLGKAGCGPSPALPPLFVETGGNDSG